MNSLSKKYLFREYVTKKRSFSSIAEEMGTYPNKIRRAAISMGIIPRDKSSAQKEALGSGRHKHPTKGTRRSSQTKEKISNSVYDNWQLMDSKERDRRSKMAQKQWEQMTEEQRKNLLIVSNRAIRKASKEGSKLEKFILESLTIEGYRVEFHKERALLNEKLEIDLFIPELSVAIEVDGPSHFEPVWGQQAFERTQSSDRQKSGLVLSMGLVLIRIKHTKGLSEKYKRETLADLKVELEKIKKEFPKEERFIEIGE
jgi:very-short-patch-repair endonuclease|tara:strand:+ start:230 stop:1000 length:771 start_codon:yes stop_codon:yes gene_type:complete